MPYSTPRKDSCCIACCIILFASLQVTHILKDVFMKETPLMMCLNVSPASSDFREETLQLLEQMSLPQKLRSAGAHRYETLFVVTWSEMRHDLQLLLSHSLEMLEQPS